MKEQLALLPQYLTAHLQLTLLALVIGIGFSVPLGIVLTRRPRLEKAMVGIASVIQTIPSLALLAVMVPLLGALGLTGIGFLPAIVALTLYSILPVLRNTITGIGHVDPALTEAARGVGMTERQVLMKAQLPAALPVIVAGIRTATVWTVGMATLSTPIGAPSLGNYIFSGLQTRNYASVLVGCVAAAVLALILDGLIRAIEVGLRERRKLLLRSGLLVLALLCLGTAATTIPAVTERKPVTIGAKTFTEQYILGDILAGEIKRDTGAPVEVAQSLGSTVAFDALRTGGIDTYVEYTGTIWATLMKRTDTPKNRAEMLRDIESWLKEQHAGVIVASLGFENTYALAIRSKDARDHGIKTISDLAGHAPRMSMGADYEFLQRPEWTALQRTYGLTFSRQRSMDPSLMYQALANGDVDVISAFSTDGRIAALDLTVLDDDKHVIPPYDAVILASERLVREQPAVVAALTKLNGAISSKQMQAMNQTVDGDHHPAAEVADQFLDSLRRR